jgi:hypothetical protein
MGDSSHFRTDKRIDKRGFACIRRADERDKTTARLR